MADDIDFLRSLPSHPGPMGTMYVTIPKLARDWLCDQAERVAAFDALGEWLGDEVRRLRSIDRTAYGDGALEALQDVWERCERVALVGPIAGNTA